MNEICSWVKIFWWFCHWKRSHQHYRDVTRKKNQRYRKRHYRENSCRSLPAPRQCAWKYHRIKLPSDLYADVVIIFFARYSDAASVGIIFSKNKSCQLWNRSQTFFLWVVYTIFLNNNLRWVCFVHLNKKCDSTKCIVASNSVRELFTLFQYLKNIFYNFQNVFFFFLWIDEKVLCSLNQSISKYKVVQNNLRLYVGNKQYIGNFHLKFKVLRVDRNLMLIIQSLFGISMET